MPTSRAVRGKDATIYVDAIDASEFLNEYEFESQRDDIDVTPLGADDKLFLSGSSENTVTLTGFWNGDEDSLDGVLDETFGSETENVITICPGGVTSSKACYLATATQVSYDTHAQADDVTEGEAEFRSARIRGKILQLPIPVTATGTMGTPDVTTAATARGATANLHVLDFSGTPTTCTIDVEHSADGTVWAPFLSFTVTAKGGQMKRTSKTTAINEQIRWNVTITGGTTPAVTFVLAVGRRA
jgi:hypothetical protein